MIKTIAVLLTCHNRREKTISCLTSLHDVLDKDSNQLKMDVFLTDDGSTDGTTLSVAAMFPLVRILKGNGNLFWAGGMRNSWNEALKFNYDAYLLLNDDTNVSANIFVELMHCDEYAAKKYNSGGIYICSTHDDKSDITYGGSVIKSKFFNTIKRLVPNGHIQECDLGNANIMLVTRDVIKKIGILSSDYVHGIADFDYCLTAKKKNIPVLIAANYCGFCHYEHPNTYDKFVKLSFLERKKYLLHPKGLAFADSIKFMKKFYPYRVPFIYAVAWLKLFFPNFYVTVNKLRRFAKK